MKDRAWLNQRRKRSHRVAKRGDKRTLGASLELLEPRTMLAADVALSHSENGQADVMLWLRRVNRCPNQIGLSFRLPR